MKNVEDLYGKPWSKSDYLIVLSAYFKTRGQPNEAIETAIHDVSHAIGRANRSVGMRFANFASIDPEVRPRKKGLDHINQKCRTYFAEWCNRRETLHEVAAALRSDLEGGEGMLFDLHQVRVPFAFRRYELGDLIGEGTFGAVYSCFDPMTEETRAIKILRLDKIEETSMLHRFRREIKILRTITHRNVISLHEDNLESEERFPAFIMDLADCSLPQYLSGKSKAEGQTKRPVLTTREAVAILSDVMLGVIALHEHDPMIVHRDINPNNVLRMLDDRWVIADFTLSKFQGTDSTYVTATTTRGWGTGYYASPEQWSDFKATDHRCDVHALGALIWDLFTSSASQPRESALWLPTEIEPIVRKAMAHKPDERYASVRELRDHFLAAAGELDARAANSLVGT